HGDRCCFPNRGQTRYFFGASAVAAAPGVAFNALTSTPSATFQTRTSPLCAPAATDPPSGENATEYTQSVCPLRVRTAAPLCSFQMRTVWSALQVASSGCFGLWTSLRTGLV